MSESEERAKLLQDNSMESVESDGEDTKMDEFSMAEPSAPGKDDLATLTPTTEELKHSSTPDQPVPGQPELPPPYEPGDGSSAGKTTQHGSGWTAYGGPYVPMQPPPPAAYTSVQNQTTVVQVQPYTVSQVPPPPPPTYLGLAIFATLCCFWPLGIAAIIKSNEVNKFHGMRNYELARQSSEKARSYSRLSIIIGIVLNIISGVFLGVFIYFRVIAVNVSSSNSYNNNNCYYNCK